MSSPPPVTIQPGAPRPISRPWIGLFGPAGVGKDTLAAKLAPFGVERLAFADPLREAILALDPYVHDVSRTARLTTLVEELGWDRAKRDVPEVRRLLQRFGTDSIRALDPDLWTRVAENRARDLGGAVAFTDCRFPNEAQMIRRAGGLVVRIEGDPAPVAAHVSEVAMSSFVPDLTVHNPQASPEVFHPVLDEAARFIVSILVKGILS